jgi:serine protease Do
LAVGQAAYVIGAPYGFENSFSAGHISGFREFGRLYDGAILAEFIQTDAAINSGNSGGPVFNSQGEVVGIASRILTESGGFQGLGFVVAINTAKQLLALEDRPWMGIDAVFLNADMLNQILNLNVEGGLLVQHVAKGSPADKAGLRGGTVPAQILGQDILLGGDLIVEFNTQEACHSECLVHEGKRLSGLKQIPVNFLRSGKMMRAVIDVSTTRRNFLKSRKNHN